MDTDDSLSLLQSMGINPSLYTESFQKSFAKCVISRYKNISFKIQQRFRIFYRLLLPAIPDVITELSIQKNDIEDYLTDVLNYSTEEVHIHYLEERNIFQYTESTEDVATGSLLIKWATTEKPTWITFALTSPRFQNEILEELIKDPSMQNESILKKMLLQEDTFNKQRLEFLALV